MYFKVIQQHFLIGKKKASCNLCIPLIYADLFLSCLMERLRSIYMPLQHHVYFQLWSSPPLLFVVNIPGRINVAFLGGGSGYPHFIVVFAMLLPNEWAWELGKDPIFLNAGVSDSELP